MTDVVAPFPADVQAAIDAVDKRALERAFAAQGWGWRECGSANLAFIEALNRHTAAEYVAKVETYEVDGHTAVFTSQPPVHGSYGTDTKGRWHVTIDGIWRATVIFPHGWGPRPYLTSLVDNHRLYGYQGQFKLEGDDRRAKGKDVRPAFARMAVQRFKDGKLPSRREIVRLVEEDRADRKRRAEEDAANQIKWAAEAEAHRVDLAERKRKAIEALESLAARLNLTEEELDGLPLALDFVRRA